MARKAAYVLPVSENKNERFVLLGRELRDGKYSGFGGGLENRETPKQAAAREAWEESMGFLGNKSFIRSELVRLGHIDTSQHTYYTMLIPYDALLPSYYRQAYMFMANCGSRRVSDHCAEKSCMAWVNIRDFKDAIQKGKHKIGGVILNETFAREIKELTEPYREL